MHLDNLDEDIAIYTFSFKVEVETGRSLTFGEFLDSAERLARRLICHGLRRGDVVAVFSANSNDFLVFAAAVFRIGAVPAFVNYQLSVGLYNG